MAVINHLSNVELPELSARRLLQQSPRDGCEDTGMEKGIAEQLNKAFEAYRTASIERDNAKRELKQKTEYYERYTLKLLQQIEDQNKQISLLKAQLNSTSNVSGEPKCYETGQQKQEVVPLSPGDHRLSKASPQSFRTQHYLGVERLDASEMQLHGLPGESSSKMEDILEAFQEVQEKFQRIQKLTKRQKDHLGRVGRGSDSVTERQFCMPIQCTDGTVGRAEASFSSSSSSSSSSAVARASVDEPLPISSLATVGLVANPLAVSSLTANPLAVSSLASRGASPEDGDPVDSLSKLSVKFPPHSDSEYDFLNSAPEKPRQLPGSCVHRTDMMSGALSPIEEPSSELGTVFTFPRSPPPSSSSASVSPSMSLESVRGPQQPLWTPELHDVPPGDSAGAQCPEPHQQENCAFCHASVPHDRMYSHLNSHFKNSACN